MADPETSGAGPISTDDTPSASDEAPSWFKAYESAQKQRLEAVEGRIGLVGKDMGRLREKLKGDPTSDNGSATPPANGKSATVSGAVDGVPSLTRRDLLAAQRLGQVTATLPEAARSHVERLLEEGRSFVDVLELAEMAALSSPASGEGDPRPKPPTGSAASAAPRSSPPWPGSIAELRQLSKQDPKRFSELMSLDHPFDPYLLPQTSRR